PADRRGPVRGLDRRGPRRLVQPRLRSQCRPSRAALARRPAVDRRRRGGLLRLRDERRLRLRRILLRLRVGSLSWAGDRQRLAAARAVGPLRRPLLALPAGPDRRPARAPELGADDRPAAAAGSLPDPRLSSVVVVAAVVAVVAAVLIGFGLAGRRVWARGLRLARGQLGVGLGPALSSCWALAGRW